MDIPCLCLAAVLELRPVRLTVAMVAMDTMAVEEEAVDLEEAVVRQEWVLF
jgi:hypothetical protein